jgi:hypothetical protein
MEPLLYDYHIVQAMGIDVSDMKDYHVKLYYDYVFKKYGVTKALFDSSLVWYTRHPAHLTQIYNSLKERLDNEVAVMLDEKKLEEAAEQIPDDVSIDTLELWRGMSVTELTSVPYNNRLLFSFKSDSSFLAGDSVVLRLNTRFYSKEKKLQQLYAALLISYNDTTPKSVALNIEKSGSYVLQVPRNYDCTMKEVKGFIFYDDADDSIKSGVVLSDLSLLRIHPLAEEEVVENEELTTDEKEKVEEKDNEVKTDDEEKKSATEEEKKE